MKTIVVAVDGSPASYKGLAEALLLAKPMGARLELIYVSPPVLLPPSVYAETIKHITEAEDGHAKQILSAAAKAAGDVECDQVHLQGPPAEMISDYAQRDDVWGVVIGAKGHNALSRVMLGSTADRVIHTCHKPVLVVH
jgi:nucleotide-binding universal stress UspA family protein